MIDMTIIHPIPTTTTEVAAVTFDLYRDIHKGIRAELFAVTLEAGSIDPTDDQDRAALDAHVSSVAALLASHAEHEDTGIDPALDAHLPDLAEQINADHHSLEARMERITDLALVVRSAGSTSQRHRTHQLYLELASFTSAYLAHQDLEERVVMPALEAAVGVEAVVAMHLSIIGAIPPAEMMQSLALMLPAMNVDDRAELLGGMQATAPPEAFDGVVGLVRSVLNPGDASSALGRLGLS
jgi:hypothetical protein